MQDLVGICIADPAEDMGIGQSAFQRVVADGQAARELIESCGHHVHAAGIERGQSSLALRHVQRGALLRSCLGQREAAVVEQERGESATAIGLLGLLEPVQSPRDHQVQDQPHVIIKPDRNALTDAP